MNSSLKRNAKVSEHVVFLGESGFPRGLATIQRVTLMGRALLNCGVHTTVVCRKGVWKKGGGINFEKEGSYEGINYIYTSKDPYRPNGLFSRNFQKAIGIYGEIRYLKHLKRHKGIDLVIVSDMKVIHVLRYILLAKFLNFPIVVNFVEMVSSMQNRHRKPLRKINDYLLDKWVIKMFDGALPISSKLADYYTSISPAKPMMKLPIICDFEKFDIDKNSQEPYFLYCGNFKYREVRDFVVNSFKTISGIHDFKLYMIVSGGNEKETILLKEEINKSFKTPLVKLFSNIPYSQLVELYVNATALLIPLRPTVQDTARFPHKIGEYLASGNPVVTTNVGEIMNYFVDEQTALVADGYNVDTFGKKMEFVINNQEKAKEIGRRGKVLGLEEFDYRTQGHRLKHFIKQM